MNSYTVIVRHSTVTFSFTVWADSTRGAYRAAGRRIRDQYQGFRVYRLTADA